MNPEKIYTVKTFRSNWPTTLVSVVRAHNPEGALQELNRRLESHGLQLATADDVVEAPKADTDRIQLDDDTARLRHIVHNLDLFIRETDEDRSALAPDLEKFRGLLEKTRARRAVL